jgi:hypothetical protein
MKLYQYTIYNQDGTIEALEPCPKKGFIGDNGLYELLNCSTIQLIPSDYYKGLDFGKCTVYGDEEGRFNKNNQQNPHFNDLGDGYNLVGNIVKEEVYHPDN